MQRGEGSRRKLMSPLSHDIADLIGRGGAEDREGGARGSARAT